MRQRWIIGIVALVLVAGVIGVLLLGGGDGDDGDSDEDRVATQPQVLAASATPTQAPTLARRPDQPTARPTIVEDTPIPPTALPIVPTLRPSPTPYLLPTASGPRRLDIPKLNFTRPVPIIELPLVDDSWDVSRLGHNVGWLEKTTWLEPNWGNTVLVAHVQVDDQDPGPFYYLWQLEPGDEIVIMEGEQQFTYRVIESTTVSATAMEVTLPSRDPILTLLTCTNWDMARGIYADRLIVRAVPVN